MSRRIAVCCAVCVLVWGLSWGNTLQGEAVHAFNQKNLARGQQVLTEDAFPYLLQLPGGMVLIKPCMDKL